MTSPASSPLRTFVMYAHEDRPVRDKLLRQLRPLADNGDLDLWSDHEIKPGELWDEAIRTRLAQSDLILLLISDDFFASDYIRNVELREALARHERGETRLLPIIARHCGWDDVPALARLQVLPPEGRPIVSKEWDSPDEPYRRVYEGVKTAVREVRKAQAAIPPAPVPPPPAPTFAPSPARPRRWLVPALLVGALLLAFALWRSCAAPGRHTENAAQQTPPKSAQQPEKQASDQPVQKPSATKTEPSGTRKQEDKAPSAPSSQQKAASVAAEIRRQQEASKTESQPKRKSNSDFIDYDDGTTQCIGPLPPVEGMIRMQRDEKPQWTFLNAKTQKLLPEWYESVENFGPDGRAYVKQKGRYFYIDKTGRCVEKCQ